jgi:pSer/pThr/pTyr-binding forkhead associated (FHA) protein
VARLIVRLRGKTLKEVRLGAERLRIGRAPECDIVVNDDGVSRVHATVASGREGCLLEDAGSRNGITLNGERIDRAWLEDGDRVRMGEHLELEFLADRTAEVPSRGAAAPDPNESTLRSQAAAPRLQTSWWRQRRFRLRPEPGGPVTGDVALERSATTVGRDPAAGLVIEDESVSRMHARFQREGDEMFVVDLKSRNGTRVNDHPALKTALADGDRVEFGNIAFEVLERRTWAWRRFAILGGAAVVLIAAGLGLSRLGDWLGDRTVVAEAQKRLRRQVQSSVLHGIEAYDRGDLDYARGYLLYAGDLLLLTNLAPPGTSLAEPAQLFRGIARELPPRYRNFDYARALDAATIAAQRARLEGLSNREFVERQVRSIAIELGQDADIPPGFVEQVATFVDGFARSGWYRSTLQRSVGLQRQLRDILAEAHLPEVFCYVAWVESSLIPTATSPVGARGLWQFMPPTGRQYGLRVDVGQGIDDRTNVVKSTRAAGEYIGDLIRKFGREQFMCALASYNRGENAVFRAMEKIPDPMMSSSRKYWYLVENGLLPRETSEYVPKIFAVRILAEDPERFGLTRP